MSAGASKTIPQADLEQVVVRTESLWRELNGERVFITGATGFMGTWLIESLAYARKRLGLDLRATALTRDVASRRPTPWADAGDAVQWQQGDVRSFASPPGRHGFIIHAATDTNAVFQRDFPRLCADIIVSGTRRILELAETAGGCSLLYLSSGAVYGRQPAHLPTMSEDYEGAPDSLDRSAVYGQSKRLAETLCAASASSSVKPTIARCFAFVGPLLPLDGHFAVGNFIADALAGRALSVNSDGRSLRSYLHPIDLVTWLLTVMLRGNAARAYNVGSDQAISIGELAGRVAALSHPPLTVRIRDAIGHAPAHRYVPSIERARNELGLEVSVTLDQALERTLHWARESSRSSQLKAS